MYGCSLPPSLPPFIPSFPPSLPSFLMFLPSVSYYLLFAPSYFFIPLICFWSLIVFFFDPYYFFFMPTPNIPLVLQLNFNTHEACKVATQPESAESSASTIRISCWSTSLNFGGKIMIVVDSASLAASSQNDVWKENTSNSNGLFIVIFFQLKGLCWGIAMKTGDPQVTMGFNTNPWSIMTWMIWGTPMT